MHNIHGERDSLRLIVSCPSCQKRYDPSQMHLMSGVKESYLWHVTCTSCQQAVLISVLVNERGIDSVGVLTDLRLEEAITYSAYPAISADDCLEIHESLVEI